MKFFILNAVLAACAVTSLVGVKIALRLYYLHLMAKCLRRVQRWARRQVVSVATAKVVVVAIARLVRLIVVMARGMYSIGSRFQIAYTVNPLHNNSNFVGCNCQGGCRRGFDGNSMKQSVDSSMSYLWVELSFLFTKTLITFPERPVKRGG